MKKAVLAGAVDVTVVEPEGAWPHVDFQKAGLGLLRGRFTCCTCSSLILNTPNPTIIHIAPIHELSHIWGICNQGVGGV